MKVLFIGGTGNISAACSRLALETGIDLYHLNRRKAIHDFPGVTTLVADVNNRAALEKAVEGHTFDVVVNFIAFKPEEVERDIEVFGGKTAQYIFISSASAYQKPGGHPVITESTPLYNPYWDYSRDKIACENLLMDGFREKNFPATIVRPSLTYETVIPVAIGSWTDFTIIERMRKGKQVVIHGDGTSLWTVTHSTDFAKGFNGLLGHQQALGHAFHITSDEILTWNQIYEAVAEAAGAELNAVHMSSDCICSIADTMEWEWMRGNLHGDKAPSMIFDNTKIKRFVPGFNATIPFKKGIADTVKWFDEHPEKIMIDEGNNNFLDALIERHNCIK